MGVVPFQSLEDYWVTTTKLHQVASLMLSKRFSLIRRTIHFNDNTKAKDSTDRFFKVRPLVESIRSTCLNVPETPRQSIDEVMLAYKGRTAGNLCQYIKSKPTKWGYKLFSRASDDSLIHDMVLYQGKETFVSHTVPLEETVKDTAFRTKIVVVLAKTIKLKNVVIFADNYFSSIDLLIVLKEQFGFNYTGTARENRIGKPPLMTTEMMNKKSITKSTIEYCSNDEGILIAKWKDNKVVTLIINDKGIEPISKIQRYDKETHKKVLVDCPFSFYRMDLSSQR